MKTKRVRLGVNLDHIAFIKKSRDTLYPSLADAVKITEDAGADLITIHLREDRRHIQDSDAFEVRECAKVLNFEMAHTSEMIDFALKLKPDFCCIVPEKREEKTTEGGLNLKSLKALDLDLFKINISRLREAGIKTSLFIDPNKESVELSKELGAELIELHTGHYANKFNSIDEMSTNVEIKTRPSLVGFKDKVDHMKTHEKLNPFDNVSTDIKNITRNYKLK